MIQFSNKTFYRNREKPSLKIYSNESKVTTGFYYYTSIRQSGSTVKYCFKMVH